MGKRVDLKGQRFGRLIVRELDTSPRKHPSSKWICVCDCGKETSVRADVLKVGGTNSCGCLAGEVRSTHAKNIGIANATHGMTHSRTYKSWLSMRARCNNPKEASYKNYGGRGIKVCDRWQNSFENFLADMGERPEETSLDRFPDKNGNYEPGNCRWATQRTQQNNKRSNRMIKMDDKELTVADWARETGISVHTILARIDKLGWSVERALTISVQGGK